MRRLLAIISVFEAFSLAFFAINLWFFASIHGGSVTIAVSMFDERWAEYVLWLVLTPVLVVGLHYTLEEFAATE